MKNIKCVLRESSNNSLISLSEDVLFLIDQAFKMFQEYTDDSYEKPLQQILYNLTKNNEGVFGPAESDKNSGATTLIEKQSNEKTLTFGEQSSSSFARNRLYFRDDSKEALESKTTQTNIVKNNQESVQFWKKDEELNNSEENAKIGSSGTSGTKMSSYLEQKRSVMESKNIRASLARNSMKIASVSISIKTDIIEVKIDVFHPSESPPSDENPRQELKQDLCYPDRVCGRGKAKIPSGGPSKCIKSNECLPGFRKFQLSVDYSNPWVCYFLFHRLLSILASRKAYMKQICNSLEQSLKVIRQFKATITLLTKLMQDFEMANHSNFGNELDLIRNETINKADEMSENSDRLFKDRCENLNDYLICLQDIVFFENENLLNLTKSKPIPTIQDLKKLELRMMELCKKVDEEAIFYHEMKLDLFDFKFGFERLVKHLIKYLFIKDILGPSFVLIFPPEIYSHHMKKKYNVHYCED